MGTAQRSLPMDPSSIYGQGMMQPKPGIANAGILVFIWQHTSIEREREREGE